MNRCIDFVLEGIARVRLLDASSRDEAVVRRQLGPIAAPPHGEADIGIRFVDSMPSGDSLRYLGDREFAYSDDEFYVLRGKHKSRVMVRLPIEAVGEQPEIVCCRGVTAVPYLIDLINLTALRKGFLPLHASAIRYQKRDILVTGWAKGGKTETVLGFADRGASYIGDEWIYLSGDGREMSGIPEPIRIWDWHLRDVPRLRQRLTRPERLRLTTLRAASLMGRLLGRRSSSVRRVAGALDRQRFVQIPPARLFGGERQHHGRPNVLFFVVSHDSPEYRISPIGSQQVAERMLYSMLFELSSVRDLYLRYRFAFPQRRCELLETLPEIFAERLSVALRSMRAYEVLHPYPVSPRRLFEEMEERALWDQPTSDAAFESGTEVIGAEAPQPAVART